MSSALPGRKVVRVDTVGALRHVNAVNGLFRIIIVLSLKVEHDALHDFSIIQGVCGRRRALSGEHGDRRALL